MINNKAIKISISIALMLCFFGWSAIWVIEMMGKIGDYFYFPGLFYDEFHYLYDTVLSDIPFWMISIAVLILICMGMISFRKQRRVVIRYYLLSTALSVLFTMIVCLLITRMVVGVSDSEAVSYDSIMIQKSLKGGIISCFLIASNFISSLLLLVNLPKRNSIA